MKFSALFIVLIVAMLFGGCATHSAPPPDDVTQPAFPAFTSDSSPAPPNYDWIGSPSLTSSSSAFPSNTQE